MGLLDVYYAFIDKECADLMLKNLSLKKNSLLSALDNIDNMSNQDAFNALMNGIADTPLFDLAENWLAEQVVNNASNMVNTLTGNIADALEGPLTAARNAAFNIMASAMLFQQELIYYFAMKTAEEAVTEIERTEKGMRANLQNLKDSIRRLHNALMALAHTGDFYEEYLAKLRRALELLVSAYNKLKRVDSGFQATDKFQTNLYQSVKADLDAAADLILPKLPKPDISVRVPMMRDPSTKKPVNTGSSSLDASTKDLQSAWTAGAAAGMTAMMSPTLGVQTTSSRQFMALQAMWQIPKLVLEMLAAYDMYAAHVFNLNTLVSGFMGITAPKVEMFSFFKSYISKVLNTAEDQTLELIHDMALALNGSESSFTVVEGFTPSPSSICARTPLWGIRVKAIRAVLEGIDVSAMDRINEGSELAQIHANAVSALKALGNLKGDGVIMHRNEGKEEIGDLEPYILALASQSALALVDNAQFAKTPSGQYKSDTVIMASRRATSRVDLSLQHCDQVSGIMSAYISETKSRLKSGALGDSLLALCDQFGMDNLKGELTKGNISAIFKMGAKNATYVGAALTALNLLKGQLADGNAQSCIDEAINDLSRSQRAKELEMTRTAAKSTKEQIKQNEESCSDLRQQRKKMEQCATGGGFSLTNTTQSISDKIQNIFQGLMGDSLPGTPLPPVSGGASTPTFANSMIA